MMWKTPLRSLLPLALSPMRSIDDKARISVLPLALSPMQSMEHQCTPQHASLSCSQSPGLPNAQISSNLPSNADFHFLSPKPLQAGLSGTHPLVLSVKSRFITGTQLKSGSYDLLDSLHEYRDFSRFALHLFCHPPDTRRMHRQILLFSYCRLLRSDYIPC